MRKYKETEQEAIERRKQMYGSDGECVYSIYNPETKDYEEYMCGGVDTCDETRVSEWIATIVAGIIVLLTPILLVAGVIFFIWLCVV